MLVSLLGTHVMTITATDKDDAGTSNGAVRYRILAQSPEIPTGGIFSINSESGSIVTMVGGLDREVSQLQTT